MVNSNKLTVSKLSKLQKTILKIINNEGGIIPLSELAYEVASQHHIKLTPRLKEWEEHVREVIGPTQVPENRTIGEKGGPILEPEFKAIFYRSVQRLVKRGLLMKGWDFYYDDFFKRKRTFKVVSLTTEGKKFVETMSAENGAQDIEKT